MLEKVSYDEVPRLKGRGNPNTAFSERTIKEFVELNCDAAKVTGFPITRIASSNAATLKKAVEATSNTSNVSVVVRDGDVYLIRKR